VTAPVHLFTLLNHLMRMISSRQYCVVCRRQTDWLGACR
jgi:hypothetical protein